MDARETGDRAWRCEEREYVVDTARVGFRGNQSGGEQRLDLGGEQEQIALLRPLERADAEAIARQ